MAIVEKRGNSYSIRVSIGYTVAGKQVRKNFTWTPDPNMSEKQIQKELNRQVVLFEERAASGNLLDGKIKFSLFSELWIKDYAEKRLAPKTVFEYRSLLTRIDAAIGHIRLDRLRPTHLNEFYNNLAEEGIRGNRRLVAVSDLSDKIKASTKTRTAFATLAGINESTVRSVCANHPVSEKTAKAISDALCFKLLDCFEYTDKGKTLTGNTIKHYHRLLSSILQTAVKWQLIESNPASRVEAPKTEKHESKYLDELQTKEVIRMLDNESLQFRTMIILFIYSGFRRGELAGLQWPDIDFKNNLIHVSRTIQYLPKIGVFIKNTKNVGSERSIKIPSVAIDVLKQFKTWQDTERLRLGDVWQADLRKEARTQKEKYKRIEWVFTSYGGRHIFPDTITDQFNEFTKKNNLPHVGIHGLRHTNATLQIASGVNIRTVSNRLGHAQTSTTSNIYAHAIQSADAAAADVLENLLNPTKPQVNHNPG